MDVGVDLNVKYAIMCCKTLLIPENDDIEGPMYQRFGRFVENIAIVSEIPEKVLPKTRIIDTF